MSKGPYFIFFIIYVIQGSTKTLFCIKNQPFCFQNVFCPKRVFKTRFKTRHLFQSLCPRFAIFLFQMFLFCFDFLDVVDVVFKFCGSQCVKYSLFCFCFIFWWSFQRRWLFGFAFHYSIFFAWSFCSACFVVQLIIFQSCFVLM